MFETDLLLIFIRPLNELGLSYMVTGSVAGVLYGEPRVTHDVDLVLAMPGKDAERVAQAFPMDDFYCPPVEVLLAEAMRGHRGHFNLIHHQSGFRADVYLAHRDEFQHWALKRRQEVVVDGVPVPAAPPEYVIVKKLEFYREGGSQKHLRDIAGIMRTSGEAVSRSTVDEWVKKFSLENEWAAALAESTWPFT